MMPVLTLSSEPQSSSRDSPRKSWASPFETRLRRRRCVLRMLGVAMLFTVLVYGTYAGIHHPKIYPKIKNTELMQMIIGPKPLPPLYHDFRKSERRLPQHFTKPFASGEKYLWVASHSCCSGWGNVMQDLILTAHLTHASGRGFVFDDYEWVRGGPAYSEWNGKVIPAHIPLSAIISGPLVGGKWDVTDQTPLSISKEHFEKICPNPYILHGERVRVAHGDGASAQKVIETWINFIAEIEDPCVEVPADSGPIFHPYSFGNKDEILPVWPTLSTSPVLTHFGWSSLAHRATETNQALLGPISSHAHSTTEHPYSRIDGLLVIHIRRGDFLEHCENLGHWGAAFLAFNRFPEFLDPWEPPQGDDAQKLAIYLRRCVPTIPQIVDKVTQVQQTNTAQGLKKVYIMTNGDPAWLKQLKDALKGAYAWDSIATSRDMILTLREKYVSHTVDMLIGQRAQVFIGNGFSSVSSNVAMLRQANGFPLESTRML
ncbi:hypothetical protein BDY19DRAFT_915846 [Irpex rosettiformis]|uniref:Uncharacterized protein n=1 Tax=Irpex rosettiformis TaxID=378272 RepID=A0ACB8ULB7_9APHY|nr:hypothetical protein BDY19DRAFT_915846 [Irpex rosettiformis]